MRKRNKKIKPDETSQKVQIQVKFSKILQQCVILLRVQAAGTNHAFQVLAIRLG